VRPDGVETDVGLVLEKLVAKVEGQEVRAPRRRGGAWAAAAGLRRKRVR